jgi:hypothetical protein
VAKRSKVLRARKPRDRFGDDESLLMRSAESLGRVIGSLQRQLDGAAGRLSATADEVMKSVADIPLPPTGRGSRKGGTKKKSAATSRTTTRTASSRKTTGTKRTTASARKSAKKR